MSRKDGEGLTVTVTVSRKEVVAAALPLQEYILPLSNLDLLLPPLDVGVFFCYARPAGARSSSEAAGALKRALAQALVTYPVFAGEVAANSMGEPEVLCNNRGVDFVEARADVCLGDLRLHYPDEYLEHGKLLPEKQNGAVLSIQVTGFVCGGIVVGCTFNHQVADAYSTNMFLVSWAEVARSRPVTVTPSFDRSLLRPRRHHHYYIDSSIDSLYVPTSAIPLSKPAAAVHSSESAPDDVKQINRIYHITSEDIERLQSLLSSSAGQSKRTKLEAFCAHLWKAVAAGAASGGRKARECSLGVVVNGRRRLARAAPSPSPMDAYFGNVLSVPYSTLRPDELERMELRDAAAAVHETIRAAASEEHFLGLVDWVEARRPEAAVAKVYCADGEEAVAVVVSSGQSFPVTEVDFGWGRPAFGSYHFPWGGNAGYVMPMASAKGGGEWVVYAHLEKGLLAAVEEGMGDVLRPLPPDYMGRER